MVVSHIPILTATALLGKREADGSLEISAGLMHTDSGALQKLFEKSGHVKTCIDGHIHRIDRVNFRGIQYRCNGAVIGGR